MKVYSFNDHGHCDFCGADDVPIQVSYMHCNDSNEMPFEIAICQACYLEEADMEVGNA